MSDQPSETLPLSEASTRSHSLPQPFILGGKGEELQITFLPHEERWIISFKCRDGKIISEAYSPLELTTILYAIGTKRLWPHTETISEALFRGLSITKCPTMFAWGGEHRQNTLRHPLPPIKSERKVKPKISITLEELLKGL